MTTEIHLLAWTLVLAVVQILIFATVRTKEVGLPYAAGPRDLPPPKPLTLLSGRLQRAQNNLFETLPLFAAAILILHALGLHNSTTVWGATLYFWARLIYFPIYVLGIAYVRTLLWAVSLIGLVMLLLAILSPMAG